MYVSVRVYLYYVSIDLKIFFIFRQELINSVRSSYELYLALRGGPTSVLPGLLSVNLTRDLFIFSIIFISFYMSEVRIIRNIKWLLFLF